MQRWFRLWGCPLAETDPDSDQAHHHKKCNRESSERSSRFWIASKHFIESFE